MNTRRIWIEIVLVGSAISVGLALLLASIGAAAGIPEARNDALQAAPAATQKAPPRAEQVFTEWSRVPAVARSTLPLCNARQPFAYEFAYMAGPPSRW